MPMQSRRRAISLLLSVLSLFVASTFAQNRAAERHREPTQPSMATLVHAIKSRGENTVLSGYVAVVMDVANDYLEQVPAKAISVEADATHSRLLCLVTRNNNDTILMIELADGYITAYATTASGALKQAAHGKQYEEFELIPKAQASAGFRAAKEFWFRQTRAVTPPAKKTQ